MTPRGEGGSGHRDGTQENHECHEEVQLQVKLSMQWRHLLERVEFLLGLWTLLIQFVNKREAKTGLKLRNKSKTTYTALAAIMLDCVS